MFTPSSRYYEIRKKLDLENLGTKVMYRNGGWILWNGRYGFTSQESAFLCAT